KPFVGKPVSYRVYFSGPLKVHLTGVLGGLIWGLGTALSYIAAGKAGAAVSYALGQGATLVAALWGLLIWKEFRGASRLVNNLLAIMVLLYILGLACITISGLN
nr:multidrug DMT transporter permease [Sunxiuqinia sp.]